MIDCCECGNEPSFFLKCLECLEHKMRISFSMVSGSVDSVTHSPFSCLYFPLLASLLFVLSTIQGHGQLNIVPDTVFYHKVDIITLNFKSIDKTKLRK